jgi:F5/8 type C domain
MTMKNILFVLSAAMIAAGVSCSNPAPRRPAGVTGGAGTTAAAGTSGGAGTTAAAGTTGAAGDGSAGTTAAAGTTGAAGDGSAGTTAAGGTTGAAGTVATPVACANMTVITAGGAEATCPAKTTWVATANPTPASKFDGIADTQLQPKYAIDGDTTTRYSSGAMMAPGFYFQVDLGKSVMVSGITVDTSEGADVTDVAQAYEVELSTDGTMFTPIAMCASPAAPMEVINFKATMARYVRYTNTAASATGASSWLSIHEFDILCN